ncbi:hypothetical protein OIDMADRAFT_135699 [Oidiodendron maius Zn]|uniref:Glutathione synthase n=1 Tax=Oidiodendron maius (strain Zn) TaxID=913774 RepID=A0A0C3GT68_OIDMZ|nr:hypothetical protein OIDMADRAFT_135699 [Oidiodendron maius Zn]
MDRLGERHQFQQICVSATSNEDNPVTTVEADAEKRQQDREALHSVVALYGKQHKFPLCAHPMLVTRRFIQEIKDFNEVLVIAIGNIVERWWEDTEAAFPSRMPLERHEETVLQRIHQYSKEGQLLRHRDRLGQWRADILLQNGESSDSRAGFSICEINARGPLNSILTNAYGSKLMGDMTRHFSRLEPVSDPNVMLDSLFAAFEPNLPLHFIRGDDPYTSTVEFEEVFERRTGMVPKVVNPANLRLLSDPDSYTGYSLYCVRSSNDTGSDPRHSTDHVLERIHQAGLQLFHHEYRALSSEILLHLGLHGVNDLRTIFHVNDKRILGIIHQEIDALVNKHGVLTAAQGELLQRGVVPTTLPGSPELEDLISQCRNGIVKKEDFIVKPCRGGRGFGHILGESLSTEEWESMLMGMQDPTLYADKTQYIIQPFIQQPVFDLMLDEDNSVCQNFMVGTYYIFNGRYVGLGGWRSSPGKLCSMTGRGGWRLQSVAVTGLSN